MDAVTDKDTQDQVALMGAFQRRAGEILALPIRERESRYDLYRTAQIESALLKMNDRAKAEEFADKMDEWLRWIVGMTETAIAQKAATPKVQPIHHR